MSFATTSSFFCSSPKVFSECADPCEPPQPGERELFGDPLAREAEPHEELRELARGRGMLVLPLEDEPFEIDLRHAIVLPVSFAPFPAGRQTPGR